MPLIDGCTAPQPPVAARTVQLAARIALATTLALTGIAGHAAQVYSAGVAYSGDMASIATRFPHSKRFFDSLEQKKIRIGSLIQQAIEADKPENFEVAPSGSSAELKGQDQAVVLALVLNHETVSVESYGEARKLFVQLRAQALFFDFKSQTVLRAYPISFAYIDLLDHDPSQAEIDKRIRSVFVGTENKPGMFGRFVSTVKKASLPNGASKFLQVAEVTIGNDALPGLAESLKQVKGGAETWAADMLGEAISNRADVPMLPYAKGYAVGKVMSVKVADGDVYSLKLPEADYTISLNLTGVKRVELQKTAAETAYVYGSYAGIKVDEPFSSKKYLDLNFKNGETKLVPVTQSTVDDIPAYADSIRGLFSKVGENLSGKTTPWLKTAASGSNIEQQINQTAELFKSCR